MKSSFTTVKYVLPSMRSILTKVKSIFTTVNYFKLSSLDKLRDFLKWFSHSVQFALFRVDGLHICGSFSEEGRHSLLCMLSHFDGAAALLIAAAAVSSPR